MVICPLSSLLACAPAVASSGSRPALMAIARQAKEGIQRLLRRCGYELVRYPLAEYIQRANVSLVIDVGAHTGEYGQSLRAGGFRGRIVSFEPQAGPYQALARRCERDPAWSCFPLALGEHEDMLSLHVAPASATSSLLAVASTEHMSANYLRQDRSETVRVVPLDSMRAEFAVDRGSRMLKIDTQGYEMHVLAGARRTLSDCALVQIELSLTPLYEGAPAMDDVIALLRGHGFEPYWLINGFKDARIPRMLQVDAIFFREGLSFDAP